MGGIIFGRAKQSKRPSARRPLYRFRALLRHLRSIKTWQLLLLLIPLSFAAATLLRFDHLKMSELKTAVLDADRDAPDQLATRLSALHQFTSTHTVINIVEKNGNRTTALGTGPFYLEHEYHRRASAALAEAEEKARAGGSDQNPHGNVFAKAMSVCRPLAIQHGWTWDHPSYINCFTSEINKYPTTDELTTTLIADLPSTALFRHDFASPLLAFTPASFVILLCVVIVLVLIFRLIVALFFRLALLFVK